MKFESYSGNRRSRRANFSQAAPAMVEALEMRALLAAPQVLTPTGTISDSTPVISWQVSPGADSYDLWVSDVETREVLITQYGLSTTSYTPTTELQLHLGRNRIWVRANNSANATTTGWSPAKDVLLQVAPDITGPTNPLQPDTPLKIDDVQKAITWTSPPGARSFELLLSNQTTLTSTTYKVANRIPSVDANGNVIPDGKGDLLREEVRTFYLDGSVPISGAVPVAITDATNTSSIEITSVAHGLTTGEKVRITGVEGNTAANGTFLVTVVSADVFQLKGVAGNGAYIQGGTLVRLTEFRGTLPMGQYRAFMRTTDDGGRVSGWSAAYNFEVAPAVKVLRPSGPSFQNPPLLEWQSVAGATHYEVLVSKMGLMGGMSTIYNPKYLTTTSYQIPRELAKGDYVFWVRARRLNQVTEINLRGIPTTGTYRIVLTTSGRDAKTVQTGLLSFNATAAQIKTAVNVLKGFEKVDVVTVGATPNLTHLLEIPQTSGPVKVSIAGGVSPGTITTVTRTPAEVVGLWSDRKDFGTIRKPLITGPVGLSTNDPEVQTVTDVRPTLEWGAIDKAARYEIWVDRTASSSIYLSTTSTTNSYQFESDILPGNYFVWVQALSTTGVASGWSEAYKFTATGGAPLITLPVNGSNAQTLPTIKWIGVPEADHYEIHIAWINVDYDFIQTTGITGTEFTPVDPLNTGTFRVWVRAIKADGTVLRWSAPVTFIVAENADQPTVPIDSLELVALTSLLTDDTAAGQVAMVLAEGNATGNPDGSGGEMPVYSAAAGHSVLISVPVKPPVETPAWPAVAEVELIEKLAQACTTEEWWSAT